MDVLTVRVAENGVTVTPQGDYGAEGKEYVFTSPADLGNWMLNWMETWVEPDFDEIL
jgi:hypothetical protein